MEIPFWKMHGAGNDFVLVDDRQLRFPCGDSSWLAGMGARRTGVGCDGFILIQPSDQADFRMRFFNPDGGEVEMCANGARCVARLAAELGAAPSSMTIDTVAGRLHATVDAPQVLLGMPAPTDWSLNQTIQVADAVFTYSKVNTGVPHVVIETDNLDTCSLVALGSAIRHHAAFAPAGANVNFVTTGAPSCLSVRTYERGVEAETLACGTGVVATALVMAALGVATSPVRVRVASSDTLTVTFDGQGLDVRNVTLKGPTRHVFRGTLVYP